jgi:preprotein translocase subunit SecG
MFHSILMVVQIITATCIIALVLVQRGKGADAGAGFGSGASGTVFGARGATTALSRATAILAAVFMMTSLALAYMVTRSQTAVEESVLERLVGEGESTVPVVPGAAAPAQMPAEAAPATTPAPATAPAPAPAPPAAAPGAPATP